MQNNNSNYCPKCGKEVPKGITKCPNCGAMLKFSIITIVIVLVVVLVTCFITLNLLNSNNDNKNLESNNTTNNTNNNNYENNNNNSNNETTKPNNYPENTKNKYGFDETVIYNGLELTFHSNYSFDIVENRFSDYNNMTVVKVPVTVKNISNETTHLSYLYYDIFGANGTELDILDSYFDNSLSHAGNLRSGASYTKDLCFLYDGDGTYAIEFNKSYGDIEIEFNIKR